MEDIIIVDLNTYVIADVPPFLKMGTAYRNDRDNCKAFMQIF